MSVVPENRGGIKYCSASITKLRVPQTTVLMRIAFQWFLVQVKYAQAINPRGINPPIFTSTSFTYIRVALNSFFTERKKGLCGTVKIVGISSCGPEGTSLRISRPDACAN